MGLLEPMSEEELAETMQLIRESSKKITTEFDFQIFWEAWMANRVIVAFEENGSSSAIELSREKVLRFRESYREGLSLGDWNKVATKLYDDTNELESEQGSGINSVTRSALHSVIHFNVI